MNKKAAEIALSTIIIAGIALLVLVIIVVVFSGKIKVFNKGYSTTTTETTQKICATYKTHPEDTISKSCVPIGTCLGTQYGSDFIDCGNDEVCCGR